MITDSSNVPKLPNKLPIILDKQNIFLPGCLKNFPVSKLKHVIVPKNNNGKKTSYFGVAHSLDHGVIATAAIVHKVIGDNVMIGGLCRIRIIKIVRSEPYILAEITQIEDHVKCTDSAKNVLRLERAEKLKTAVLSLTGSPDLNRLIKEVLNNVPVYYLAEICASMILFSFEENLNILNTLDTLERIDLILDYIQKRKNDGNPLRIKMNLGPNTSISPLSLNRSPLSSEITKLGERIKEIKFPPEVAKIVDRDYQILSRTSSLYPDHNSILSYLNLIVDLPWNKRAEEILDLRKSKSDLETDHYGLEKVKKRVLEHLAVRKLRNDANNSTILCLVGPPGVGKTSIARSIAATLNRPFERVSLGGVSNMADIRGHRRTYVASMPGRIIQAIKRCGVINPVILLDEIDKMTLGLQGNPAAALLEVLDPTQNKEFLDHYLNVPFDLSQIMFIATANSTKNLTPALYDRLEIIQISAYTYLEKIEIALKHLLNKQLKENGLNNEQIVIPEETIQFLISHYTREAGVRGLERKIGALCRAVAVQIALDDSINSSSVPRPILVDVEEAKNILGPLIFESNKWSSRIGKVGVAIGLVITQAGGDTCAVETTVMPGRGLLALTGSLGDVMKESAQLAWGWVRSNAAIYGVDLDGSRLKKIDVHIHFPEGAVGKDGPSAGITITAALMSLFLDRPIMSNIAMTGEITLQGVVLPVGGIKNKIIAAHKDGFTKIIMPQQNAKNLQDIPKNIKAELSFVLVSDMHAVLQTIFEGGVNMVMPLNIKSKI